MSNTLELYKQALQKRSEQANLNKNAIPKASEIKSSNGNVYSKVNATLSNVVSDVQTGMIKGVEGIFDSLIGVAGTVGSLFGAGDTWAKNITGFDVAKAYNESGFGKFNKALMQEGLIGIGIKSFDKGFKGAIDDIAKSVDEGGYINQLPDVVQDVISGVASSIGQMLPSIALGAGAGALGASANVAKALSMASFGAGAMGGGIEQAVSEGHGIGMATGYGALQGVKEIAIEAIGGKLGSNVLGIFSKGSSKAGKQTIKSLLKEVSKQAIGEGAEEALGDLFEPLIEKATINKDGNLGEMYGNVPQQMITDFVTGALTGMLMSGGQTISNIQTYGIEGARVQETITEANEVVEEIVKLEKSGRLDADTYKVLQSKLAGLNQQYQEQVQAVKEHYGEFGKKAQNISSFEGYMDDVSSASSQDLTIRDTIAKYNNLNKTKVGYKSLDKKSYADAIRQFNGKVTYADKNSNAFIDADGNIYVNKDSKAYKEGKLYNSIGHEFIHAIENADGYNELYNNFVKGLSDTEKSDILNKYKETYGNESEQYLLEEAFADYIGENITVNYKEFSKMLGTNSKWSKIKEKLLGYKGVLTEGLRNTQTKVKNALQEQKNTTANAKQSRNINVSKQEYKIIHSEIMNRKSRPEIFTEYGLEYVYTDEYYYRVDYAKDTKDNNFRILSKRKIKSIEQYERGVARVYKGNGEVRNIDEGSGVQPRGHNSDADVSGWGETTDTNGGVSRAREENSSSSDNQGKRTIDGSRIKQSRNSSEKQRLQESLDKAIDKYDELESDYATPAKRSKGAYAVVEAYYNLAEEMNFNLEDIKDLIEEAVESNDKAQFKENIALLEELVNEYTELYDNAYDMVENVDTSYDYENPRDEWVEAIEERYNQADDYVSEIDTWKYEAEELLDEYKEYEFEGDSTYEQTNDFRELLEECRGMSSERAKSFHNRSERVDEGLREGIGRILQTQLKRSSELHSYDNGILKNPKTGKEVKIYKNVNPNEFHDIFEMIQKYLPEGDMVDVHEIKSSEWSIGYEECACYLMEDGLSGFAITPTGDLISVFNLGQRGFLRTIKDYVKNEGAKTLDCYNSKVQALPDMYEKLLGFKTASILDFNYDILVESRGKEYADYFVKTYGEAPVHFMVLTDENVKVKSFDKTSYEDAVNYQLNYESESNSIVKTNNQVATQNKTETHEQTKTNEVGKKEASKDNSKKEYKQQTPLPTDSNIAWKSWQHLTQQKVYSYTDSYNAVEELIDNVKSVVDGKITVKGGKKALATKLMQDLANQTNLSINDVAVKLTNNFNDVLVDGVSLQDVLDGIESGLYSKFVDANIEVFNTLLNNYKPAKYQALINKYNSTVSTLKNKLREAYGYATELIKTVKTIDNTVKKHDAKVPVGERATDFKILEELQPLMDKFKLLRRDYLKHDIRNVVLDIQKLLTTNEHLIEGQYVTDELLAEFNVITDGIEAKGNSKLNVAEMKALRKIIQAVNHIYATYDSAIINGKKVVASELAKKGVNDTNINVFRIKHPTLYKVIEFIKDKIMFINPMTKFSLYQNRGFEGSYFESVYRELQYGENKINEIYDDLTFNYIEYMKKHKNLATRLANKEFEIDGVKLTDAEVVELYMLSERGDTALRHILTSDTYNGEGIKLIRDTHNVSVKVTQENLDKAIKYVKSNYVGYLDILQEIFWKKSGKYLNETVKKKTGYELTDLEEHYFPINTDPTNFEKQIGNLNELNAQHLEMINPSFTKSTSKNANNAILIQGVDVVLSSFARKLSNYAGFSPTVQNINRIMNSKVEYNGRECTFMKYMQENVDIRFNDYMNKLLINMQGRLAVGQKGSTQFLNNLRGNLAKYFLGFNPKTIASQFASYPLIATKLSVDSMTKGITMKPNIKFMEENSIFFKRRFESNGIQMSQFLVENNSLTKKTGKVIDKVGDLTTKPMNYTDKLTMGAIFNSSIVEIAKKNKMSVNQVKNNNDLMLEALQLAEDIVRQTQASHSVLDNGSQIFGMGDIAKSLLMFTADARKAISSVIFSFHESKITGKKSGMVKTVSAVVASQILVALIASAFKQFLNKNDEDKDGNSSGMEFLKSFGTETWHNLSYGMIPFVRDIAGFFTEGYEISDMNFDYINDLLTAISEYQELVDADSVTRSKAWYRVSKLLGQTFGIPTKNLTEYTNAILAKCNVDTAIKTQNILYSYSDSTVKKNLTLAYKQNRTSRVKANLSTILEGANLSTPSTEASLEIARLYSEGYHQVLPSTSVSSFSIDGQTYTLSNTALKKFSKVYDEATLEVEDLISNRLYKSLTDEQKAKAIKRIYQAYYGIAKSETVDAYELSPIEEALYHMDGSDLVVHLAKIDSIKATKYKSRKEQVLSYINSLRVSPKAKTYITSIAGYNN